VSRSLSQPSPHDWPSLLLEAIQQRDAPLAVVLAQRCVHRHGIAILETTLERADAAAGQEGEARAWLFLVLKQGSPAAAFLSTAAHPTAGGRPLPSPVLEPPASVEEPRFEPPSQPERVAESVGAAEPELEPAAAAAAESQTAPESEPPVAPEPASPLAEAKLTSAEATLDQEPPGHGLSDQGFSDLGHLALQRPHGESLAFELPSDVEVAAVGSHDVSPSESPSPSLEPLALQTSLPARESPPRERTVVSASASAALDQAFAPLEIAFPPLPTREHSGASLPAAESAPPVPPPLVAPFRAPLEACAPLEASAPAEPSGPSAAGGPAIPQDSGDPAGAESVARVSLGQVHARVLADVPTGTAAPVPTFRVDPPADRESLDSRRRPQPDAPGDRPGRASKALEAWRAWLPGPFRSRPRPRP